MWYVEYKEGASVLVDCTQLEQRVESIKSTGASLLHPDSALHL